MWPMLLHFAVKIRAFTENEFIKQSFIFSSSSERRSEFQKMSQVATSNVTAFIKNSNHKQLSRTLLKIPVYSHAGQVPFKSLPAVDLISQNTTFLD